MKGTLLKLVMLFAVSTLSTGVNFADVTETFFDNFEKDLENLKSESVLTGTSDGHEWVDLGLPSGARWATCNLGAAKPEDKGYYFAWGETKEKKNFTEQNSQTLNVDFSWLFNNGFIDSDGNLTMIHDAANQSWGGSWRMPTYAEIKELADCTQSEWTTANGVTGLLVKSKINGATIFLPASGMYDETDCVNFGGSGDYWSSTVNGENRKYACSISFNNFRSLYLRTDENNRCIGRSIRPVLSSSENGMKSSKTAISVSSNASQKLQKGSINGHEWVDLGLPSGIKWATCNVGATTPEGSGSYFAWGETRVKREYDIDNSATYKKPLHWIRSNGYIDSDGNLTMAHDAARQNWGGTWRMPTLAEIKELKEYTTTEWTTQNGIVGRLVTSKMNGASIFLPATGRYILDECSNFGGDSDYWSSTAGSGDSRGACTLHLDSDFFYLDSYNRCYGLTVRPVTN